MLAGECGVRCLRMAKENFNWLDLFETRILFALKLVFENQRTSWAKFVRHSAFPAKLREGKLGRGENKLDCWRSCDGIRRYNKRRRRTSKITTARGGGFVMFASGRCVAAR